MDVIVHLYLLYVRMVYRLWSGRYGIRPGRVSVTGSGRIGSLPCHSAKEHLLCRQCMGQAVARS